MRSGFFVDEAPAPTDPTALDAQLELTLSKAAELRAIPDPESEPYSSRYSERQLLKRLSQQAAANSQAAAEDSDARRRAVLVQAIADAMLGVNFMDTEESGQSAALFEAAAPTLQETKAEAVLYIELLNRQAILSANRQEHEPALALLQRACEQYEAARAVGGKVARKPATAAAATPREGSCAATAEVESGTDAATKTASDASVQGPAAVGDGASEVASQAASRSSTDAAVAAASESNANRGVAERLATTESETETPLREAHRLEDMHTLTCYYLAQAYANLGRRAESAAWVQRTLQRQLQRRNAGGSGEHEFDSREWAKNSMSMASFYAGEGDFVSAEHFLNAADAVLGLEKRRLASNKLGSAAPRAAADAGAEKTGSAIESAAPAASQSPALPEELLETMAHLDIAYVDLCASLLRGKLRPAHTSSPDACGRESAPATASGGEGLDGAASSAVRFSGLRVRETRLLTREEAASGAALDFARAREVYLCGAAHAQRAKAFFVLDGFVTDHCAVLQSESALLGALIEFEPDAARRFAMQKKRIDLMLPPLEQLNEKVYVQITRQARFDVAAIRSEMLEIKAQMHAAEPPAHREKRLAPHVDEAVKAHREFLGRFDKDGAPPQQVEAESEAAYLTSWLQLARALGKRNQVESLSAALSEYRSIAAYIARNDVQGMDAEAGMCKEMVELLPRRIADLNMLQRQGA